MMLLHLRSLLASLALDLSINVEHLVGTNAAEFNYEVEGCIINGLTVYTDDPVFSNRFISKFRLLDVFLYSLCAADRDAYMGLNNALSTPDLYYSLKDGGVFG